MIKIDKIELEQKYLELKTVKAVADHFQVSRSTIQKYLSIYDITAAQIFGTRGENRKKYICDDSFFSQDNELSFYIAGFIAADGCVHYKNKNSCFLSINLSAKDSDFLIKVNNILKSNRPIHFYENGYGGASVLNISSRKLCDDLQRFNIVPTKSLIYTFPSWIINHPLKSHFMRGYFDGDGCFYIQKQSNEKVCFNLRGTPAFLNDYRNILEQECNFTHRNYDIPMPSGCGMLAYGGNRNIIKISNFLYKDATICLDRKRQIALRANQLVGNLYVQNS
jgi:hypothetical protein